MKFQARYLRLGEKQVIEQMLVAQDDSTLRKLLSSQGYAVLSVKAIHESRWIPNTFKRTQQPSFPLLCRELRTLIRAGMTVVEALESLSAKEALNGKDESLATKLLLSLNEGASLSSALEKIPATPSVLIAAVRAGERTSNLAEALDDYLRFDQMVTDLKKKIISASIYPLIVSTLGLVITLFLLLVVMPNFASMYDNFRSPESGSGALTIQLSRLIGNHRSAAIALLAFTGIAIGVWIASGLARKHILHFANSIIWIRRRVVDFQLAMMYQALALLVKGGYPLVESIQIASRAVLSKELATSLEQALKKIEYGASVSQSLAEYELCDEVGRRLIAAAERNGNFHLAADVVSRLHGERFELFVERLTRVVEPILLLLVALVVGGLVVMMYLPVFDMATQLL